jgi:hypothetical protein
MSALPPDRDALERQHRQEIIEMMNAKIVKESVSPPVRLEFDRLPNDDTFDGIVQRGPNIWLVTPRPGEKRTGNVKVERVKDAGWTCGCRGWQRQRYQDCTHIKRVRYMIGDGGAVPYDGRRRRPRTKVLYGSGLAEDTRRAKAREAEPAKVRLLAKQLCMRFVKQPARSETRSKSGGANGAPLCVRVYCLLAKVFWNVSYEQLRQRLEEEGTLWELGLLKADLPRKNTLSRWFGNASLTPILTQIFRETTKPTRRFDTMIVGDSHDIPTRMVDNSRDRKFGPKPALYRNKDRPLIRQHFAAGKISGIIFAADTTLAAGLGSADGPHLANLLEQTKDATDNVRVAAFDKAYDGKPNFREAERLGMDLYVREKVGEDRQDQTWPPMAQRLSKVERDDPATYAETSRFRSKGELTPARIKARNPYIRLRRRNGDQMPTYPIVSQGTKLSDLPREVQSAVFDAATQSVGVARLNESLAILILANLRALNTLEHVYDQEVTFEWDVTLNPPIQISERDLRGAA